MIKKFFIVLSITAALLLVAWILWSRFIAPEEERYADVLDVTIAEGQQPIGGLVYIAEANHYFKEQGLNVTLQPHTSGKAALNAILDGRADLATTSETPIVFSTLANKKKVYIISTIGTTTEGIAIIARKDLGILKPSDLKGKKIGVTAGTNGAYFLDSFLLSNGIGKNEVELINLKPEESVAAVLNGSVDAFSAWNPHLSTLQKRLAANGTTFYNKTIYLWTWNLVAGQDYVTRNPEIIGRVVKALVKAEDFAKGHPEESQKLIAAALNISADELEWQWNIYKFRNSLTQEMLMNAESQATWAIENHLTTASQLPNYLDYIYSDALEKIKPDSVTLIK